MFENDKPHGEGIKTLADGVVFKGKWSNGSFIKGQKVISSTLLHCIDHLHNFIDPPNWRNCQRGVQEWVASEENDSKILEEEIIDWERSFGQSWHDDNG